MVKAFRHSRPKILFTFLWIMFRGLGWVRTTTLQIQGMWQVVIPTIVAENVLLNPPVGCEIGAPEKKPNKIIPGGWNLICLEGLGLYCLPKYIANTFPFDSINSYRRRLRCSCHQPKLVGKNHHKCTPDSDGPKYKYNVYTVYLHPPRGAKWMVTGATKRPLRVQTPPLGGCIYFFILDIKIR